ncbi:DUF2357 domain-containing protein [Streptomyces griseofuscus]|uniref:DUF2357 domain-containing protein n=1 Tax=Streptomyces griseofuscus TaxID=146922 RepID=UPI00155A604F|nr:DUF2357 domain-containing protein [Streptomyces griseofuscus]
MDDVQPFLNVDATTGAETLDVQVFPVTAESKQSARFFEDTTYRLYVKSHVTGKVPVLLHRDPLLFRAVDSYPGDFMCAGPINFGRQVGRCTFDVHVGHDNLRLTFEVFPAKIDYATDYRALLADITTTSRALALEYLRATYQTSDATEVQDETALDWLTLLRNEVASLERSMRYVNEHPHRILRRKVDYVRTERIRRADSTVRNAILRARGHGAWLQIPGMSSVRSHVPSFQASETLDTAEHRWLRLQLSLIRDQLSDIATSVTTELESRTSAGNGAPERLVAEEREISSFTQIITELLGLPLFNGVTEPPPPGFSSLTLLTGNGYGEAYRVISVLKLGLSLNGTGFDSSVMDVHGLYETWCYIEVLRIVLQQTAGSADLSSLLSVEENGIRVRLTKGRRTAVSFQGQDIDLDVSYNESYRGLTGEQKPDIVLRFRHPGWPDLIVLLDAKYRVDFSSSYHKQFGCAGPPVDGINALHRYRDATVVGKGNDQVRPVVKGAALFPLSSAASSAYPQSKLHKALDTLGIGALPFLPGNTAHLENWIQHLLSLAPEDLAEPGLPFAGLVKKNKSHGESE